jgi:hypothetical protein
VSATSWPLLALVQAGAAPAAARFRAATADVERAQAVRLRAVLSAVRGSRQAQRLGLDRVRTARELRVAAPLCTADTLAPDIEAIARGERQVLSRDPVLRFEPSGGSSGPSKLCPMTRPLLGEFQRALWPWLHDLLSRRPALKRGPSYWSISPLGARHGRTAGGVPVGSAEDVSYFPRPLQPLLARVFAVPGAVAALPDVESCRYATLRCLAAAGDLAFVSVWNPSFLTLLLQDLDAHAGRLAADLERGGCRPPDRADLSSAENRDRRDRIDAVLARAAFGTRPDRARILAEATSPVSGVVDALRLWPRLALVSLWTDAQAARTLGPVRARLPGVELQGKGLLATEGVVSIPLCDAPAPVLAVRSHFYEFLDDGGAARGAHELLAGQSYEVVITTSGGLLRYRMGDRVEVQGFLGEAPCLRFLGRADRVSDLVGEKLADARVGAVLTAALARTGADTRPAFAMMAPEWSSPPAYHLFLEWEAPDAALAEAAGAVEAALGESHSYRYARELGQLGPVRVVRVVAGARRYEARCVTLGQRAGDVKPVDLHHQAGWLAHFGGQPVVAEGRRAAG